METGQVGMPAMTRRIGVGKIMEGSKVPGRGRGGGGGQGHLDHDGRGRCQVTFHSVCISQGVECVLAGHGIGRHIGYHDCARLLPYKGIPQHLRHQLGSQSLMTCCTDYLNDPLASNVVLKAKENQPVAHEIVLVA